ncbi:hypothetical protein HKD37_20G056711 [Glycine soja]
MKIMVRVRGFGQTLDRVIVRTLGREVSCDVDEGPNGKDQQHLHLGNKKFHLLLWMLSIFDGLCSSCDCDSLEWRDKRLELKLFFYGRKVEKFGRFAPQIEGLVTTIGLSSLIACSLDTGDRGLLFAFAKR